MGSSNSEKYYATSDGRYNKSYYVGWTYETSQRTLGGTESNAKVQTEKWYSDNISAAAKDKTDKNGKFCNDRNVGSPISGGSTGYVTTWSENGTKFMYTGAKRLWQDYSPTLNCNLGDIYTIEVGAISADEAEFGGGKNSPNNSFYLNTGLNYWTMSPASWEGNYAYVFYIGSNGYLHTGHGQETDIGIRPVINLRSDVTFNAGSDGTQNNPYIVQ